MTNSLTITIQVAPGMSESEIGRLAIERANWAMSSSGKGPKVDLESKAAEEIAEALATRWTLGEGMEPALEVRMADSMQRLLWRLELAKAEVAIGQGWYEKCMEARRENAMLDEQLGAAMAKVTRVTVVPPGQDSAYEKWGYEGVYVEFQDDGRTMKVFPARKASA